MDYSATCMELKSLLDDVGKLYLKHRRTAVIEKFEMPVIFEKCELRWMFWCDFSQNLKLRTKYEPQEAHFEGKEYSLHCSITSKPNYPLKDYSYHISGDHTHDGAFTEAVIYKIAMMIYFIIQFYGCESQYKSKKVFVRFQTISTKLQKTAICYYGNQGHGKRLVCSLVSKAL